MSESNLSLICKYFIYYFNRDFLGDLDDADTFKVIHVSSWRYYRRCKKELLAAKEQDPDGYAEPYKNVFAPPTEEARNFFLGSRM